MTITHRRILYSVFFLMFFLAAPVILLITAGYRIDYTRQTLVKTSTIVLSFNVEPDRVLLDGKVHGEHGTTLRLNALVPGIHSIRLEKDGYNPWEKILAVEAGEAIPFADIHLIRRAPPQLIGQSVRAFAVSPDQRTVAIVQQGSPSITLYDPNNGATKQVAASGAPDVITGIAWSPSGQQLLLRGDPDIWVVLSPFDPLPAAQALLLPKGTERAEWDSSRTESILALRDGDLTRYAIAENASVVLERDVIDWQYASGSLYALQQANDGYAVTKIGANSPAMRAAVLGRTLPRFLPSPKNILTIIDSQQQVLTLMETDGSPMRTVTYQNTTFAAWNAQGTDLLIGNAVELTTVHHPLQEAMVQTITRAASGFWNATWLQDAPYLLASQQSAVKVYETAFGSPYQSSAIFTMPPRQLELLNTGTALIMDTDGNLFSLQLF